MEATAIQNMIRYVPIKRTFEAVDLLGKVENDEFEFGMIEGFGAIFDNIDSQREVIRKGAFTKTINQKVKKKGIPLMVRHLRDGGDALEAIGLIKDNIEERTKGLWFRSALVDTQIAQDARTNVIAGAVTGLSVGFRIINASMIMIRGKEVLEITEMELFEITLTVAPANDKARVTRAKSSKYDIESLEKILTKFEKQGKSNTLEDQDRIILSCFESRDDAMKFKSEVVSLTNKIDYLLEFSTDSKKPDSVKPSPDKAKSSYVSKQKIELERRRKRFRSLNQK